MGDIKELARRTVDAVNAHTADLDYLYAEDAELVHPSGHVKGREAVIGALKQSLSAFSDARMNINGMIAEGDTVAMEYTISGTNTGELRMLTGQAVPPTKKRLSGSGVAFMTFKADKVVWQRMYFDRVAVLTQLGLMPEGAAART